MKTGIIAAALALLVATGAFAAEQMWNGSISDKMCGIDHSKMGKKMSDRDCTITCTKGGAPYALLTDGKVIPLANREEDLRTHAGHLVTVTGELKRDTIRVSKVEMAQ
jgi:hypothetical protein